MEDPKKQEDMIRQFNEYEKASKEVILMELKIFMISKSLDSEIDGIDRYKEAYDLNEETNNFLSHIQSRLQSIKQQLEDWMNEVREYYNEGD